LKEITLHKAYFLHGTSCCDYFISCIPEFIFCKLASATQQKVQKETLKRYNCSQENGRRGVAWRTFEEWRM